MAKHSPTKRSSKKPAAKPVGPGPLTLLLNWVEGLRTNPPSQDQTRKVAGWSLVFFCVIGLIACVSYYFTGNADQSAAEAGEPEQVSNWLGFIGAWLAELIVRRGFGIFGFVILLYGLLIGMVLLENDYYVYVRRSFKYVVFITLFGSIFLAYVEWLSGSFRFDFGGGVGATVNMVLFRYIGKVGVAFLLLFALVIFIVLNYNAEVRASKLVEMLRNARFPSMPLKNRPAAEPQRQRSATKGAFRNEKPAEKTESPSSGANPSSQQESGLTVIKRIPRNPDLQEINLFNPPPTDKQGGPGAEITLDLSKPPVIPPVKSPASEPEFTIVEPEPEKDFLQGKRRIEQLGEDNVELVTDDTDPGNEIVRKIVSDEDQELENPDELFDLEAYDPTQELSDYMAPPFELLEDHGGGRGREVNREELESNKNKILKTLQDYGINITNIKATIGPTVTLYEIVPAPGIRISKIKNLEDDIALSLAALGIRIIAPIP
ncbi:MAG: hypothetical protein EAZ89_02875, partial [Bacteroidetes bacterium]